MITSSALCDRAGCKEEGGLLLPIDPSQYQAGDTLQSLLFFLIFFTKCPIYNPNLCCIPLQNIHPWSQGDWICSCCQTITTHSQVQSIEDQYVAQVMTARMIEMIMVIILLSSNICPRGTSLPTTGSSMSLVSKVTIQH